MSIETDVQQIKTKVASISNYVENLNTIFLNGGVVNPDIASAKAELQAWTTTQLGNYATTNTEQDLYAKNFLTRARIKLQNLDITNYNTRNFGSLSFIDKNNTQIAVFYVDTNNPGHFWIGSRWDVEGYTGGRLFGITAENYKTHAIAPTYTENYLDSSDKIVTTAFMNNSGNNIFKKDGGNWQHVLGSTWFDSSTYTSGTINKWLTGFSKGNFPSEDKMSSLDFIDDSWEVIARQALFVGTSGNTLFHISLKNILENTTECGIGLIANEDSTSLIYIDSDEVKTKTLSPYSTNTYSLGKSGAIWSNIYAGNGTIQTSDERLKDNIADIPEAVMRAWGKVKFQQFQFKDAIAKKGANARIHVGAIAQRVIEAFQSEGLDARRYGLLCWDSWKDEYTEERVEVEPKVIKEVKVVDSEAVYNEIRHEDGIVEKVLVSPEKSHMEKAVVKEAVYRTERKLLRTAGEQYSLRYEQCLCLECAYQRWVLKKIADKVGVTI